MANSPSQPEDFARALRSRFNISGAVDLQPLAAEIGLKIREVEVEGFEGALVRRANRPQGMVAVKKDIRENGRKRFCIAHEIGHYLLPGHGTKESICLKEDIESFRQGIPKQEEAANRFAAELLLPSSEIAPIVYKESVTIAVAKIVGEHYQTSLTAAALKCVELTKKEVCAVVLSASGIIRWYRLNDRFTEYVRTGQRLSDDSLASDLSKEIREKDGAVPAMAWINKYGLSADAKIWEDSILLPYYNSVLTIITITQPL
jgi:hypothetical protein